MMRVVVVGGGRGGEGFAVDNVERPRRVNIEMNA